MSVDPLAADYAGWSPYNYALNNPILYIDPDGRAPTGPGDPPKFRIIAHAGINSGNVGYETKFFGSKVGGEVNLGAADWIGLNFSFDRNSGIEVNPDVYMQGSETYSVSAGDVFGAEISSTVGDNGVEENSLTANLGIFNLTSTDNKANPELSDQYISLDFGYSAGIGLLGLDASISFQYSLGSSPPDGWVAPNDNFEMQQYNTAVLEILIIPLEEIRTEDAVK